MGQLSQWVAWLCAAQVLAFTGGEGLQENFSEPVVISINPTKALSKVRDTYVSYTIDTSKSMSFTAVNFKEGKLKTLSKLLKPAICRVGGSANDRLIYTMQKDHIRCWDKAHCLTGEKFKELADFIQDVGAQFVFGLNILYPYHEGKWTPGEKRGLYIRNKDGHNHRVSISDAPWDPTNTEALLKFIVDQDINIYGFELGNEENVNLTPEETVSRLLTLDKMMKSLFNDGNIEMPKLIGPDTHSSIFRTSQWPSWTQDYVDLAKNLITAVTYHEYVGVKNDLTCLNPNILNEGYTHGFGMRTIVNTRAPQLEVWAGEIGNNVEGGGLFGLTFGTSLWYMDALGMKASIGHTVFARQALFGLQEYTLIGPPPEFKPRPSYYTAVYAKKLLGTAVLAVIRETYAPALRTYAFCSKEYPKTGGITIIFVNIEKDRSAVVDIKGELASFPGNQTREEYHFTASSLTSHDMNLNNKKLAVNEQTGEFNFCNYAPLIKKPEELLTIEPQSYSMVVIPQALFPVCMT